MSGFRLQYFSFCKVNTKTSGNGSDNDEEPEPRSGHRIIVDDGNLYSLGGYNPLFWEVDNDEETIYPLFRELWRFNFASKKWVKLNTSGHMPTELASHAALLIGRNLLAFGGTGVPFGDTASNMLNVCNLDSLQWTAVKCTGSFPIPLYGHTLTHVDNYLYVLGGTTGWEYTFDLHRLDMETHEWSLLEAKGSQPGGRYRHEVVCYAKQLFVLGGGKSYLVYKFEKIPVYDIEKNKWDIVTCQSDETHGYPKARRCHGCIQLRNDAYISGGYNGERIYDDIWKLKLETLKWTKFEAEMPEAVYFHSASVTSQGCMVIYGGVTCIDDQRTSSIYTMWLQVPSLAELCWQNLIHFVRDIEQIPKQRLRQLGIPVNYLDRIA